MENMDCILWVIAFLLVYFIPFNVANGKDHPQKVAIFVLNFFGGWTFIGWLVALVWACTNQGNGNNQGE
ncbi:MAG: superinfection immunity protein [Alphaproteobacteria bacterium]|nr:superinfection immunity protein [Alphaproteobacteria bacterium]MBQ3946384.1 superinfection immunity protein [Alphaproteobacteria bacterium]